MSVPKVTAPFTGTPNAITTGISPAPTTLAEKLNPVRNWNAFTNFCKITVKPQLITFSTAAPAHIKTAQNGVISHAKGVLPGVKALAQSTAFTVGTTDIPLHVAGAGAGVVALAVSPVLGAIYKAGKRSVSGMLQNRTNANVLETVAKLPSEQREEKKMLLEERAKTLEDKAINQRNAANSKLGWWGLLKYAGTFVSPIFVAPQIGTLISLVCPVSTPVVLPIVIGIGAGLCGLRLIMSQVDACKERKQADKTIQQAELFRNAAEEQASAIEAEEESARKHEEMEQLRAELDARKETIKTLKAIGEANTAEKEKLSTDYQTTVRELEDERSAHGRIKETQLQSNVQFTQTNKQLEDEKQALSTENAKLLGQIELLKKAVAEFKTTPVVTNETTAESQLQRRRSMINMEFNYAKTQPVAASVTASVNHEESLPFLSIPDSTVQIPETPT